jgi:hypothetical protein
MSSTVPTVGTNLVTVRFGNQKETTIREVGGALAPIWRSYYSGIQKIIYVVDASNLCRIAAAGVLLYSILAEPCLQKVKVWNTPVLVITFWGIPFSNAAKSSSFDTFNMKWKGALFLQTTYNSLCHTYITIIWLFIESAKPYNAFECCTV